MADFLCHTFSFKCCVSAKITFLENDILVLVTPVSGVFVESCPSMHVCMPIVQSWNPATGQRTVEEMALYETDHVTFLLSCFGKKMIRVRVCEVLKLGASQPTSEDGRYPSTDTWSRMCPGGLAVLWTSRWDLKRGLRICTLHPRVCIQAFTLGLTSPIDQSLDHLISCHSSICLSVWQ